MTKEMGLRFLFSDNSLRFDVVMIRFESFGLGKS